MRGIGVMLSVTEFRLCCIFVPVFLCVWGDTGLLSGTKAGFFDG